MKYWCSNCRTVIDEDELEKVEEPTPWAYGQPCSETFWVCPCCGEIPGEYEYQDKTCIDCNKYMTEDCPYDFEDTGDICSDFEEDEW